MKKTILLAAAVVMAAVSTNAQHRFSKNDWFLGASACNLEFNHTFGKNVVSNTSFNLDGIGGYFVSDRFAVEARLGVSVHGAKNADTDSGVALGAGMRYYPVGNLFGRILYNGVASSGNNFFSTLYLEAGYDLFISEKVFFEPAVYYAKQLSGLKANGLGLSIGIGVKF